MGFLQDVFGGKDHAGFFGGGYHDVDRSLYDFGQGGDINYRYAQGAQWAQDALDPNNPNNPYAQQGIARQQQLGALNQQGDLAKSLFGQLSGNAPSIAQQQLKQSTDQNVANAFAMAQGRNNPGAARMVANQAAQARQMGAGQGSLLRAQENQYNTGMLGNLLNNMYGGYSGIRGQDQSMYGALNQSALQNLGGQTNLNSQIAQMNMAYDQARAGALKGAQDNAIGGKLLNAAAGIGGAFATGGMSSMLGGLGGGGGGGGGGQRAAPSYYSQPAGPTMYGGGFYTGAGQQYAHGGTVSVMGDTRCPGCGHMKSDCVCMAMGGVVPGYAKGGATDSKAFDVVPAMLSPGEIVLPRSVTKAKDAPDKAKAFVEAIRQKNRKAA